VERLRLMRSEVRLLVKNADFAGARVVADSVLGDAMNRVRADSLVHVADMLGSLAALTGHVDRAVALIRAASVTPRQQATRPGAAAVSAPAAIAREAAELHVLASLGVCDTRVRNLAAGLTGTAQANVAGGAFADSVVDALTLPAFSAAVPCIGPEPMLGIRTIRTPLVLAHQALAHGRRAEVQRYLAVAHRSLREHARSVSVDQVVADASLFVAIGDTAGALAHLDLMLRALPSAPLSTLERVTQAGSLVHAMVLAARLANTRGESNKARQWAAAVVTLWSGADPALQRIVAEMRGIMSR
jgi:hypothetical protein